MSNKLQAMVDSCYTCMNNVLFEEESRQDFNPIDGSKITEEFFTAELLALKFQFCKLTGNDDVDLLDFIAILNRIAVQFLIDSMDND